MSLTQDHMIKDFQLLAGTLSPAEALVKLVTEYGVVLDEHSKPVALVTADDLEQAANQGISSLLDTKVGFPATIIVGCQVMQDLVEWEGFIERYERIRGVIVIDDNGVFGILAVTIVRNYLINLRENELRGSQIGALGDSGLPGRHQSSKMVSKCSVCGVECNFSYFDYHNPPDCTNPDKKPPHKFKPT